MLTRLKFIVAIALAIPCGFSRSCLSHVVRHHWVAAYNPNRNLAVFSPDKRYYASLVYDSGTVAVLNIFQRGQHGSQHNGTQPLFGPIDDVWGFVWLPTLPHTLVYATSGVAGKAMIGLFSGSSSNKVILAAKHPHRDAFILYGVSPDGQMIDYGYAENYAPQYNFSQAQMSERRLRHQRYLHLTK